MTTVISEDEVRAQLERLGYRNVPESLVRDFMRDLSSLGLDVDAYSAASPARATTKENRGVSGDSLYAPHHSNYRLDGGAGLPSPDIGRAKKRPDRHYSAGGHDDLGPSGDVADEAPEFGTDDPGAGYDYYDYYSYSYYSADDTGRGRGAGRPGASSSSRRQKENLATRPQTAPVGGRKRLVSGARRVPRESVRRSPGGGGVSEGDYYDYGDYGDDEPGLPPRPSTSHGPRHIPGGRQPGFIVSRPYNAGRRRKTDVVSKFQAQQKAWGRDGYLRRHDPRTRMRSKKSTRGPLRNRDAGAEAFPKRPHKFLGGMRPTYVVPTEKSRSRLRDQVKEQMRYREPGYKRKRLDLKRNTYVAPTDKQRKGLRWRVRENMA